jgi:hypothetical protein
MAIVFKPTPIGKPQSAQQIGEWFSGAKQGLDDYFLAITDDLIPPPQPGTHPDVLANYASQYKADKYAEYIASIEREKRLAEQALKFSQRAAQMTPEQLAKINSTNPDAVSQTPRKKVVVTPQEVPGTVATIPTNNGAIAPEVLSEVLSTQPQYEGKSSVETAPPSGVNPLADGYQSGTSSGVPMTGSNVPPSKPPGGGNYDFEGGEFNSPDAQPQTGTYWQNLWDGTTKGFQYAVDAGKYEGRTASAAWNRAPEGQYSHLQDEGKFGFGVGRVAGDVIGNGSRQVLWNIHPADLLGTYGPKILGEDASRMAKVVVPFAAVTGLELGSQVYNPFNLGEGGRVAGYQAINPDEDDPRISTTPVSELLIDRGFLGKRGRLLPWEQFRQERTDIPYEQYEKYQNYLRNKDENALRDMTGGLLKGTLDGINGPELSVMGYSVTPTGALAAGAALLAGRELVRTGRIARFRK